MHRFIATLFILLLCRVLVHAAMSPDSATPHHTKKGYYNVYDHSTHGAGAFLKWTFHLEPNDTPVLPAASVEPYAPQVVKPDFAKINAPDSSAIQITWIGHSTFLVQVAGINILTDPVFGERASPFSWIGPKRRVPPPCKLEELPHIDAVVISHDHYDHLDKWTIKRLGGKPHYFVPLGLKKWFNDLEISNVTELDWWQSASFDRLVFRAVPSQHFSARSPFNRNGTLWGGWVIETGHGKVYFAGDAGYSPHFKEIGERAGPIKIALLPIGAYNPRWFMKPVHMNPPEAVQAFIDLKAEQAIAMHWGTFKLTMEPMGEPPLFLKASLKERSIDEEKFRVMKFGETVRY
jgi:N-acyl-phosphatidylethanolamine-hydrolysing phospholipase D